MKSHSRIIHNNILILLALVLISGCRRESLTEKDMMLFDFENDSDLDRFAWKCRGRFELSSEHKNTGSNSLRFEFHPSTKVGFSTGDVPQDWSNYKTFQFWVYNPSADIVPIYVQVNRRGRGGRFRHLLSRFFEIRPGENAISVQLHTGRTMVNGTDNLEKVDGFFLYMQDIPTVTVLYFDTFKLTRAIE